MNSMLINENAGWLFAQVILFGIGLLLAGVMAPAGKTRSILWRLWRIWNLRSLEVRMALIQSRIICLQRGYLSGYEPNLRSNGVLWSAVLNHPVEVVKVLMDALHKHWLMPNDRTEPQPPTARVGDGKDAR